MAEVKVKVKNQKLKAKSAKKTLKTVKKAELKKVVKKEISKPIAKPTVASKVATLKIDVIDTKGKVIEQINLSKEIFGAKINKVLMTQAVRVYLANQRLGTVSTKTRGEVVASTRKIYRQKGTGKARHGALSAPIFVGGGLVFGPKPRDYSLKLSKKMKKLALFSSLVEQKENGAVKVLAGLEKIGSKTKGMIKVLNNLSLKDKKILLVTPDGFTKFESVYRASRNIKGVTILSANMLNTYQVLNNRIILIMKQSLETMQKTFIEREGK
ncbi:50S ribosomal protein L4 [Patescibacteria group bacterium]|nr:50S ribosomal protein L4 [Patescibacteria group bacterium]